MEERKETMKQTSNPPIQRPLEEGYQPLERGYQLPDVKGYQPLSTSQVVTPPQGGDATIPVSSNPTQGSNTGIPTSSTPPQGGDATIPVKP